MLFVGIVEMVLPAIAQDFGTPVPFELNFPKGSGFGRTEWSPDGKWIAVLTSIPGDGIYEVDICYYPQSPAK